MYCHICNNSRRLQFLLIDSTKVELVWREVNEFWWTIYSDSYRDG